MKKLILSFMVIMLFSVMSNSYAATVWNFYDRTGWGDENYSDGDEYGNEDVWYYKYGPSNSADPSTYEILTSDQAFGYTGWVIAPSTYPSVLYRWGYVEIHPEGTLDVMIEFVSPVDAIFDINIACHLDGQTVNGTNSILQYNDQVLMTIDNGGNLSATNIAVSAGDSIFFRVYSKGNRHYDITYIDSFTLSATQFLDNAVPEPMSILLLSGAIIGLIQRKIRTIRS